VNFTTSKEKLKKGTLMTQNTTEKTIEAMKKSTYFITYIKEHHNDIFVKAHDYSEEKYIKETQKGEKNV
jgi:hypothetical protein